LNVPVVLIALLLILATPASAATVSTKAHCDRYSCSYEIDFVAAPGERNDVTLSESTPGFVDLHDAGAPVSGCMSVDANTVRCASGTTFVDLGDGGARTTCGSISGQERSRRTSTSSTATSATPPGASATTS